ncbi:MAG: hypothetical protein JSW13_00990 [Candidatus Aerophobus sp.]|nr:MAG: hypothetical protein JSW13_00990 [Candidatus Aerophobus sp.]
MLEETKSSRWGRWLALTILIIIFGYVIIDGWFTDEIGPHTAVAVYEPGGIRALVNKADKPKRLWKWPRILGTSIGVREEPIKDETRIVSTKFAMYTADEVTGKEEDREYVQVYVIDVEIKVKDWQKFFEEINLDEINRERRRAGPFSRLVKDRFEVVAYQIGNIIKGGKTTDTFGKTLRTKEGYPVMNMNDRVNYAYSQLLSRRNFLIALLDHHHFKTPEEIKRYLKEEIPWYWFAGPDVFELLVQRYKDMQESIFSPWVEDMTPEAAQQRFIFGKGSLELYREAYWAYQYQKFLVTREAALKEIETHRRTYGEEEEAKKLVHLQEEKLELEKNRWEKMKVEELIPFFRYYSSSDTELALDIRRVTAEENETLWEAAIEEVLGGEDITELSSFIIHKVEKGDTLAKLVEKYNVDWKLVFNEYALGVVGESLEDDSEKKFAQLLNEGMKTGDRQPAYEFVKNVALKVGESIIIEKTEKFTSEWFKEEEEYREKRERIVKKYIYRWIEKFAPKVVEEYVPISPWIDHLERTYGVKIGRIKLHIERDSMFTKAGEPKDEYYDLYYSKYVSSFRR